MFSFSSVLILQCYSIKLELNDQLLQFLEPKLYNRQCYGVMGFGDGKVKDHMLTFY